ncbi:MAG: TIGR03067 domain-containing protein [Zavarzinella sp.]
MRKLSLFIVLACTLPTVADDAANKKIVDALQGTWVPVELTRGGMRAPDEIVKSLQLEISKDTATLITTRDGMTIKKPATMVIDASQKPIAIDLTPNEGAEKGKPMLGIVKIDGKTLELCFTDETDDAKVRPEAFDGSKGKQIYLKFMKK